MAKKSILFVYSKMIIGGSTTALLSLLNNLDYERFEITLILFNDGGELFDKIPRFIRTRVLLDNKNSENEYSEDGWLGRVLGGKCRPPRQGDACPGMVGA